MRALHRKLLRDTVHMAGQLSAIAMIIASAISAYVTMRGSYEALRDAHESYYASARFAHVFAQVKRAPLRVASDIAAIEGVAAVDARVVVTVPLSVPGVSEPATARIVSMGGTLNMLDLSAGRLPEPGPETEVVVSEKFATANGLRPGDRLSAVLNGKWEELRIAGIGSTPEYLVEIVGAAMLPERERFGVLWMPRPELEAAFSMRGAFNDVAVGLAPGADERRVRDRIDNLLKPYGGPGSYGRDEHHPHQAISGELKQLRVTSVLIPLIFLFVSAFLVNVVLSRLVAGQRDQIAILKAFGYTSRAVAWHYSGFAILVVVAGAAVGVPLGMWFGMRMMELYLGFFNFPELHFTIAPLSIVISVGVTAAAAVGAALSSALAAARVPPAEGMRGEQPPAYHATRLEPLHRVVSSAARMILRSLERRPLRAAMSSIGIAFAVMMLILGLFTFDAIDRLLTVQLRTAERHDVMVTFVEPQRSAVRYDLMRLPGVQRVEAFRAVPVRVRVQNRSRRTALMSLPRDAQLRRLVGSDGRVIAMPERGVVLTETLANVLGVGPGDRVQFETLDRKRVSFDAFVAATVDEMIGMGAYADPDEVARLTGEADLVSGAYLAVDGGARGELDALLKTMRPVAAVAYREKTLESFVETMAESLEMSTRVIGFFACVIAFGVIYNSARIALSERGRDLATLRVLGFTRGEAGVLLLGEQAVLTILGIPLGFLLGRLLSGWLSHLFTTEEYRLVGTLSSWTYGFATSVVIVASIASGAAVWRRIARLDLVEVLKTRE